MTNKPAPTPGAPGGAVTKAPQAGPPGTPRPVLRAVLPNRPPGRYGTPWAVAAVLIVGMLIAGIPFGILVVTWGKAASEAPAKIGAAFTQMAADVMRQKIEVTTIVNNSLEDIRRQQKLVVLSETVTADITRQEAVSSWGVYWGTNIARVIVKDAKAQFYIDLADLGTSDFQYEAATQTLHVYVPRPRLDTEMISIDPGNIQTVDLRGGWARWDKQDTKDHAIADLKPAVILQVNKPFVRKEAEAAGLEAMTKLLGPLADAVNQKGAKVDVLYRD